MDGLGYGGAPTGFGLLMELLIRIVHRSETPLAPKIGESLAGDVIVACPDGWAWTKTELTNPDWRIIRVPLTQTECDALTSMERIPDNAPRGTIGQRRKINFDLFKLQVLAKAFMADDKRKTSVFDATTLVTGLRAAVVQKAASF